MTLHQERVSFFQWMLEFTSRMPRHNCRDFQKQAFSLAFAYTTSDSPQGLQARPRISQEASTSSTSSTSSSQADHAQSHGQQYPMHPPPPPPLQDQRLPLVVDSWSCSIPSLMKWFLYGHLYMVILLCLQSVSYNIIKFIRESVLLTHR